MDASDMKNVHMSRIHKEALTTVLLILPLESTAVTGDVVAGASSESSCFSVIWQRGECMHSSDSQQRLRSLVPLRFGETTEYSPRSGYVSFVPLSLFVCAYQNNLPQTTFQ